MQSNAPSLTPSSAPSALNPLAAVFLPPPPPAVPRPDTPPNPYDLPVEIWENVYRAVLADEYDRGGITARHTAAATLSRLCRTSRAIVDRWGPELVAPASVQEVEELAVRVRNPVEARRIRQLVLTPPGATGRRGGAARARTSGQALLGSLASLQRLCVVGGYKPWVDLLGGRQTFANLTELTLVRLHLEGSTFSLPHLESLNLGHCTLFYPDLRSLLNADTKPHL
ncbi:hypothetical protein JCM10207_003688 [Rhodosporidiobolus poonsookiae]